MRDLAVHVRSCASHLSAGPTVWYSGRGKNAPSWRLFLRNISAFCSSTKAYIPADSIALDWATTGRAICHLPYSRVSWCYSTLVLCRWPKEIMTKDLRCDQNRLQRLLVWPVVSQGGSHCAQGTSYSLVSSRCCERTHNISANSNCKQLSIFVAIPKARAKYKYRSLCLKHQMRGATIKI